MIGGRIMEQFKYIERNQLNSKTYYLIGNYQHVLVLNSSELKNKIISQEYRVIGLEVQNNNLIETMQSSNYIERDLFFFNICDIIVKNCSDYTVMDVIVKKLKEINQRKNQFQNDKEVIKDCLLMLKRFFNYLDKTNYTFLKTKYSDMIHFEDKKVKLHLGYKEIDRELNRFIQDGTISNWVQKREKDPYSFRELFSCLEMLYLTPYSEDRKKKLDVILNIYLEYFKCLKYNYLGAFLYNFYLFAIANASIQSVENQVDLQIPQVNEQDRIEMLNKSAGFSENVYNHNRQMILKNSRKFNKLVKKYKSDVNKLFYSLKNLPSIQSSDLINLQKCLIKYMGIVENKYDEISQKLITICNKNKSIDVLTLMGGFNTFNEYTNIPILKNVGLAVTTVGFGNDVLKYLKGKLELCLNDNLSNESRELLKEFRVISVGLNGVLTYILDSLRLGLIKEEKVEKRKKIKLYSDNSIRPLLYSLYIEPSVWRNRMRPLHVVLCSYQKNLEISWLTTNFIMCEKVDRRIKEVSVKNGTVSWNYFIECLKIRDDELDLDMLITFKCLLLDEYDWDIKDTKLNLYYFLKEARG